MIDITKFYIENTCKLQKIKTEWFAKDKKNTRDGLHVETKNGRSDYLLPLQVASNHINTYMSQHMKLSRQTPSRWYQHPYDNVVGSRGAWWKQTRVFKSEGQPSTHGLWILRPHQNQFNANRTYKFRRKPNMNLYRIEFFSCGVHFSFMLFQTIYGNFV